MSKYNQRKEILIEQTKNSMTVLQIALILLIILTTILSSNKTIGKEKIKIGNLKALDQEGQNYRLVTSVDNVQVPVPKGYVASGAISMDTG